MRRSGPWGKLLLVSDNDDIATPCRNKDLERKPQTLCCCTVSNILGVLFASLSHMKSAAPSEVGMIIRSLTSRVWSMQCAITDDRFGRKPPM
jgi:hypothetical protein